MGRLRAWARRLTADTYALYLALRDPRTPWYARAFAALVIAYAVSPIDLIPDFVPVLGLLDDLVLVPIGIALAVRLIPKEVIADARRRAAEAAAQRPRSRYGPLVIALIWLAALTLAGILAYRMLV